jgi:hypothetical protein
VTVGVVRQDRLVHPGRVLVVAALDSPNALLLPVLLMIAGVAVLALIGHFAFRRESEKRHEERDAIVEVVTSER